MKYYFDTATMERERGRVREKELSNASEAKSIN